MRHGYVMQSTTNPDAKYLSSLHTLKIYEKTNILIYTHTQINITKY